MERKCQDTMHSVLEAAMLKIYFRSLQEFCYLVFLKLLSSWGLYSIKQASFGSAGTRGRRKGLKRAGRWKCRLQNVNSFTDTRIRHQEESANKFKGTLEIYTEKLRDQRSQHYLMGGNLRKKVHVTEGNDSIWIPFFHLCDFQ